MKSKDNTIPFVEKYRPTIFDDIVLDEISRTILDNIVKTGEFPNLFFYGPPGTGKTTTIMNLIDTYQNTYNENTSSTKRSLIIHLNASDERGIDTIRTQIHNFVSSKSLFSSGTKFVILDEVDYMTKNAQQALKYLLENNRSNDIRFCLICNYISKIDNGLQNEFIKIRFNDLPKEEIINKLSYISENENINLSCEVIEKIQELYKSDMRSMINFIQLCVQSELKINNEMHIINSETYEEIINKIINSENSDVTEVYDISARFNIEKNVIIKLLFNYIVKYKQDKVNKELLDFMETFIRAFPFSNNNQMNKYLFDSLKSLLI